MACSNSTALVKSHLKRKRQQVRSQEHTLHQEEDLDEGRCVKNTKHQSTWENLDLILTLQSKEVQLERKIKDAFDFATLEVNVIEGHVQTVSFSRTLHYVCDWMQSLMLSSDRSRSSNELLDPCLDYRCWTVIKFCIKKSSPVAFTNLFRAVTPVLKQALLLLGSNSTFDEAESITLFENVFACFASLLSSNSRAFYNVGMHLWIFCVSDVLAVMVTVSSSEHKRSSVTKVLMDLSALLLEHFACFLRFYPNPKNIFEVFVDKLLEQLFDLLALLQLRSKDRNCEQQFVSMLKIVEDVMLNGLFHPCHISGFLSLTSSTVGWEVGSRGANESYHRHLFRKLEKVIREKKVTGLSGFTCLLRLFVKQVKDQQGTALSYRGQTFNKGNRVSGDVQEASIPLFDVFVHFIKPILQECKHNAEKELCGMTVSSEHGLIEFHCLLKSVNGILEILIEGNIYVRTEDTSEGKHYSFLKEVYDAIYSISVKLHLFWSSKFQTGDVVKMMLPLIVREIVLGVGCFLEIEYRVFGDDLVIIWKMLLSFIASNLCTAISRPCSFLMDDILKLGCKLIDVYSELRQLNTPLFALCKAVRFLSNSSDSKTDEYKVFSLSSQSFQLYVEAAKYLICSQEFRFSISKAVKSVPEGQACSCIQQLNVDITDALEWIRQCSTFADRKYLDEGKGSNIVYALDIDIQAEILGTVITEIYGTVLESLTISATNCNLIRNSLKNLIKSLKPSFSCLLQIQSDHVSDFVFTLTGINSSEVKLQSLCWFLLFFFRVYVSSKCLYRQSISLMPPDLSRKESKSFGDLLTSSCCMDWEETPEKMDEGYFSWVAKPSISLPESIEILSKIFFSDSFTAYAPLVYILQIMAVQRLGDLNRLITAFEFFHEKVALENRMHSKDNTFAPKSLKKWKQLIAGSRKEASDLTNFLMDYLSLFDAKSLSLFDTKGPCSKTNVVCEGEWGCGICSLDEKSLFLSVWWLFCQSTDVWCVHSTKKHLNKFFSYLFLFSVPCLSNDKDVMDVTLNGSFYHPITLHRISVEFLQDTVSFEQMIQSTNVSSRFCHTLKELLSPILFRTFASNHMDSVPNWSDLLNILENGGTNMINKDAGLDLHNDSSLSDSVSALPLKACEIFLDNFCKMPCFYGNKKSFSRYATYILNIERLLLSILPNDHNETSLYNPFEVLSLFVTCRRAMKYLVMGSSEKIRVKELRCISSIFDCSSSVVWLFKSVYRITGLPKMIFEKKYSNLVQDMIYSLIDHTYCVFLKISEAKANATFLFLLKKCQISEARNSVNDNVGSCRSIKSRNDWEQLELIAECLKEHAEMFLVTFGSCVHSCKLDNYGSNLECIKLSSVISCFQALLLGLTLAPNMLMEMPSETLKISNLMRSFVSKLGSLITVFEELLSSCLNILNLNANYDPSISSSVVELLKLSIPTDHTVENKTLEYVSCSASGKEISAKFSVKNQRSSAPHIRWAIEFFHILNKINLPKFKDSCGPLLQCLLKDTNSQLAFTLRQLFCTSAAILRIMCMPLYSRLLKYHPHCGKLVLSSSDIVFGTCYIILQEFSEMEGKSSEFSFALLDGVLTYLNAVESLFRFVDPDISKEVYTWLIDLHLKAMGRCLSLEGTTTTPSFSYIELDMEMVKEQDETSWDSLRSLEHGRYCVDALQTKLRMAFKKYIVISSEVYLEMAIQTIQRKLVGVQHKHIAIYLLSTRLDRGMISSVSAASIEFLEIILECYSGNSQFLKNSMPSLVGAIFNIILHLQNPSIFYVKKYFHDKCKVDSGAVILMCIQVLTKVVGRRLFHMDSCHVSQCFHIPMVLFLEFHKLRASCSMFPCNEGKYSLAGKDLNFVDRQLIVKLYIACCRLMCSTLKNQKRHAERCIHLLEESVSTLLCCLEVVESDTARSGGYFFWELQEAIKCASFLRRIYEELRHQKDVLGKYASLLLSNYISTFSGCGPAKAGIRREIDEALRPGVYSLIDICTHSDLQQLHCLLSEGPCRSTLATLLHDYQQNFQYEGKI